MVVGVKKARLATNKDTGKCALCGRAVREGQSVLVLKLNALNFADPTLYQHTDCLAAVVDTAPESETQPVAPEAYIARLRREVEANAKALGIVT